MGTGDDQANSIQSAERGLNLNYTKIPKDSWAIIERVLRRYPEQKREYDNTREMAIESTPFNDGQPRSNYPANRTETAIVNLISNPRMQRMEREIAAVEKAYYGLEYEEQRKVIRLRYWTNPWRNIPYNHLNGVDYSERQMHRIVYRVVKTVGKELGEIE